MHKYLFQFAGLRILRIQIILILHSFFLTLRLNKIRNLGLLLVPLEIQYNESLRVRAPDRGG